MAKRTRARQRRARQPSRAPSTYRKYPSPPPSGRARGLGRVGRRSLHEVGLDSTFPARPVLRRREPAPFFASRLRDSRILRGSRVNQVVAVDRIRSPHSSRIWLERSSDPCAEQTSRRRVLFARGNAGAAWGRGKGPFPSSMRNRVLHGCKRR